MIPNNARRVSRTASIQAPTGGLNAKDPIANMKETEAVTLENWFPTPSSVDIRNGYASHVTGFTQPVKTLAPYNDGVTRELFAASGDSIYDATTAGAVGAAVVTGLTNSQFQYINMGTAGGYFLLMVNGADKMQVYTGSAWYEDGTTTTVTGFDTADAIHINNFKNRVWFVEKDSFSAWYLPVASIGGAANELNLSGLFKMGGYLMAMANWTIDNASGVDDYAAFITSEGEVALYRGTDPSSSTTWAIVGTFRMGRPIGRRCFTKAGADVLVITTDGAFPLSKALLTDRSQLNLAATDKISDLFTLDIQQYGSIYGWQPIIHPIGKKLIINVPTTENTVAHQYVMNTSHGAWTKFTGWNAICWETLGDELYFGGDDAVYLADTGQSDNGSAITCVAQQAFSYFGSKTGIKKWSMARCIFISNGSINPAILLNVDFAQNRTTVPPSFTDNVGSVWDVAPWDTSSWTRGDEIIKNWQTVTGVGYAGGIRVVTETEDLTGQWVSTDFVYELGGGSLMLVYGQDEKVAKWVGEQLMRDPDAFIPCKAIGIERDGELVAGVVYNNYVGHLIEMTIASLDKRWCTRHNLKALFMYPFIQLNLKRVQALCSANDKGVQMFLKRLGFIHEGVHSCAYHDGGTAYSFGMLKHQCRYI